MQYKIKISSSITGVTKYFEKIKGNEVFWTEKIEKAATFFFFQEMDDRLRDLEIRQKEEIETTPKSELASVDTGDIEPVEIGNGPRAFRAEEKDPTPRSSDYSPEDDFSWAVEL